MAESDKTRWNERYARVAPGPASPSPALVELEPWLPAATGLSSSEGAEALDLAGGAGANALHLARLGFATTIVDIAARGLELAQTRAAAAGLRVRSICADLEREPIPPGPWALIVCSHYLQRALIGPPIVRALAPGGRLVWIHPTRRNLERHAKPSARFLLAPGEARSLVEAAGLTVVVAREGWLGGDPERARHLARVVAECPR